jgi:hypothetical protein
MLVYLHKQSSKDLEGLAAELTDPCVSMLRKEAFGNLIAFRCRKNQGSRAAAPSSITICALIPIRHGDVNLGQ